MRYGFCIWALLFAGGSLTGAVDHGNRSGPLRVAILWFENEAGDESICHWQEGIGLLLDKQLRESKSLRMVSSVAVDFGCRQLSIRNGDEIDATTARKMGQFIEAQRVIWGSYHRKDGVWHVSLYVLNSASGEVSQRLKASSQDWFDICDQLRTGIIAELGITPSEAEEVKMSRRWTTSQVTLGWYTKAYLREKKGLAVADELEKALAADGDCADVYGAIGATSGTMGDFDKAEKALLRAVELRPDDASSHRLLGAVYLLQNDFDRGRAKLNEALSIDGDNVETLVRLGELSSVQNKHAEAIGFFEKAGRLDPMNADVHAGLALTYALGRRRSEAVRHLKEAERIAPQGWHRINAEQKISMTYLMIGDLRQALEHHIEFVSLAEKLGAEQRELIEGFKERIEKLKIVLKPTYIEAAKPKIYTEESLDEALREKLSGEEIRLVVNPIKATDEIKLWAHELTKNAHSDMDKAKAIFDCLSERIQTKTGFGSRTAQEVFLEWNDSDIPFNCQEFTKLYLALGREVNIQTFSVYVSKLYNGKTQAHMCAAVFADGKVLLVDPLNHWFGVEHKEFELLDDMENLAYHLSQSKGSAADRIARYRIALKLCPDNYIAHVNLVDALVDQGQWDQARAVLDRAMELEPDHWHGQLALAGFAEHFGNYDAAESYCLKSLELNPEFPKTYCFLGGLLARRGRLAEARDQLRACLRYQPEPATEKRTLEAIAGIGELIGSDQVALTKR